MLRRDFVKTLGATGVALYASDLVGDLIAQSPKARVMESRFKGLSDIALSEAKRLLARGHSTDTVGVMALASVLETRVQADIRAASPVLLGTRDRKAWLVVNQMQADAGMVDCTDHARAALTPATRNAGRPTQPRITPDEDLRSRAAAGKR